MYAQGMGTNHPRQQHFVATLSKRFEADNKKSPGSHRSEAAPVHLADDKPGKVGVIVTANLIDPLPMTSSPHRLGTFQALDPGLRPSP